MRWWRQNERGGREERRLKESAGGRNAGLKGLGNNSYRMKERKGGRVEAT